MSAHHRLSPEADGAHPVWRGLCGTCPRCGKGQLFGRYLKVNPECSACGLPFHHHRADDFPPYIVMFVVGHLVGLGIYETEMRIDGIPIWIHAAIWPALTLVLCLLLLQPVKGAVVGLQFALGMHGFSGEQVRRADARTEPLAEGRQAWTSEQPR